MNEKMHNLLVRTATGVVFVAVVVGAILFGRVSYSVLLLTIAVLCLNEFLTLAPKAGFTTPQKWLGAVYITISVAFMWFFPRNFAIGFVLVVWANDVFAYLVGITFGKHGMAPRLSPKKSWEGFAGGLAGAVAVSGLLGYRLFDGAWVAGAIGGLAVALAAVAGDLTESWLKRRAGVKDSGKFLPGHGGMLDRFDAMFGAAPAAFLFFLVTYLCK